MINPNENRAGDFTSPGGFIFGVQGWAWGEQKPTSITFFLDGTAKVSDQHGRPIKGIVKDNIPVYFAKCTHAQVVQALADERVDWLNLSRVGWPQLPYDKLKLLADVPPTPANDLAKIKDPILRKDALRIRREFDEARMKGMQTAETE